MYIAVAESPCSLTKILYHSSDKVSVFQSITNMRNCTKQFHCAQDAAFTDVSLVLKSSSNLWRLSRDISDPEAGLLVPCPSWFREARVD